jgi:hypothetical protein
MNRHYYFNELYIYKSRKPFAFCYLLKRVLYLFIFF